MLWAPSPAFPAVDILAIGSAAACRASLTPCEQGQAGWACGFSLHTRPLPYPIPTACPLLAALTAASFLLSLARVNNHGDDSSFGKVLHSR